jgi:cysteinyl-tRNA synthetase
MSKSLGNFFTVRDLLNDYPGEVLRYFLMMTHYRQPIDLTQDLLVQSKHVLDRFYGALRQGPVENEENTEEVNQKVLEALRDDLNVPLALSCLHEMVGVIHKESDLDKKNKQIRILKASGKLLGILQQDPNDWFQTVSQGQKTGEEHQITETEINQLIDLRNKARAEKNYREGDRLRQELLQNGILLEDTKQGTIWRRIS